MEQQTNSKAVTPVASSAVVASDFFAERPSYKEGYDAQKNTVIRLCSAHSSKKPYKVTGIDDTASKNNWKGWLYLAPALILVVIFLIYPLINTFAIAFMKDYKYATGESSGFTFDNFGIIFGLTKTSAGGVERDFTGYAIPNTFFIVFITVPVSTMIALLISVWLNSIKWFQKTLQLIFFLPYVTNTIAVGMVFSVIFDQSGVINYIFHLNTKWIYGAERWTAMVPLCLYIIWSSLPFKILIFLSGLQGIDKQYYQAAKIDAASRTKTLWKITVPLMSPQILYIVITSFIGAFKEYTAVVGLFNGPGTMGTNGEKNMYTIVYYVYQIVQTDGAYHTAWAAAAAVFLFAVILVFTLLQYLVSKKRVYY
jgi:multiple sugar transport system permease protein